MKNFNIDRENVVFLFIDIQDKLLKAIDNRDEVIKNATILANMANILDIDRLLTVQYPKGLGYTNEGVIEPIKDAFQIEKKSFSCMLNDEFKEKLSQTGKKQVVICGVEAHICVLLTARDLVKEGYEVFVLSDAVGSRTKFNYENALNLYNDMGCVVTNVETVMFDLCSIAGTDEFKKVQKLIL